MTNMFMGVDPGEMCDTHLARARNEIRKEAGMIRSEKVPIANSLGHAKLGQIDTVRMQQRHDELEKEAKRRGLEWDYGGFNYNDSLGWDLDLILSPFPYKPMNRIRLNQKCDDCLSKQKEREEQEEWVENNAINFSKWVRMKLDEEINNGD